MYDRHITSALLTALSDTRVVLLTGPRQSGKTTLVQRLTVGGHPVRYLTLDDSATLAAARTDPGSFISTFDHPVILDEVQRAPDLFLAIKVAVDRDPRPGRFLLTGSADIFSVPRVADSLVGRMEIVHLWPLSQGEIRGVRESFIDAVFQPTLPTLVAPPPALTRTELLAAMVRGGYPDALARPKPERRRAFYSEYISGMINRDVRDLAKIADVSAITNLLSLLAARVGLLANVADLARALQVNAVTTMSYLRLLETTFLVQRLPSWGTTLNARIVKAPKWFLTDTGLLAHLMTAPTERLLSEPALTGPLVENFVVTELRKQAGWSSIAPTLWHFRTYGNQEVDIVLEAPDGRIVGLEVKASRSFSEKDTVGLRHLAEVAGERFVRGVVLYTGDERLTVGPNLVALPIPSLWGS